MSADLRVDWCDYKAAKYAVEKWHYSKTMPAGKLAKFGAWENAKFVGCVMYGWGASNNIGKPYGLQQIEICELVRVALTKHESPVSQIVSATLKILKTQSPGLRLIVSYADSKEYHHGGIYQAMNWIYAGYALDEFVMINGIVMHPRSVVAKYGTRSLSWLQGNVDPTSAHVAAMPKHRYLYPLDRAMRKQIAPLAKPYPKRETCGQGVEGDASGVQPEGAGSIPADRSDLG